MESVYDHKRKDKTNSFNCWKDLGFWTKKNSARPFPYFLDFPLLRKFCFLIFLYSSAINMHQCLASHVAYNSPNLFKSNFYGRSHEACLICRKNTISCSMTLLDLWVRTYFCNIYQLSFSGLERRCATTILYFVSMILLTFSYLSFLFLAKYLYLQQILLKLLSYTW